MLSPFRPLIGHRVAATLGSAAAGGAPPTNGHDGVAAWVTANSADVIGYWPMDDAAASGVLNDAGPNGLDGTYGSGITTRLVDGFTVANFDGVAADDSTVPHNALMNDAVACFAVAEFDVLTGGTNRPIVDRDASGGNRAYQFRTNGTALEFVKITGGVVTLTSASGVLAVGSRRTVGWWWDGTTMKLYVDGTQVASGAMGDPSATAAPTYMGYSVGGSIKLDGALGSVVMLDTAGAGTIPDLHTAWVTG